MMQEPVEKEIFDSISKLVVVELRIRMEIIDMLEHEGLGYLIKRREIS
jgi:hypothetical protein